MSSNELVVQKPLTVQEVRAQVNRIQEIMKAIMIEGEHYGIIPGCKKPSLYKPGAEKIASTFHIHIESEVEDLSNEDVTHYRVTCKAYQQGVCLGSSVGVCSSNEEKYKWKKPVCAEEWEETDSLLRREKWVKWEGKTKKIKQIRTQPADLENTMLQMADKRGYVSIVRKVTAASDVFAMDIEDLPADMIDESDKRKPIKQPQALKPEPEQEVSGGGTPDSSANPLVVVDIEGIEQKHGKTKGKAWTLYFINANDKETYSTFSKTLAEEAKTAHEFNKSVEIEYTQTDKGRNLVSISVIDIPKKCIDCTEGESCDSINKTPSQRELCKINE